MQDNDIVFVIADAPARARSALGALRVKVEKLFGESTASRILELVEHAADHKSKSESFITRFAKVYTPIVVGAAVLLAVIPPVFFGGSFATWLYRALTFLIVSCPCALVISVPLSSTWKRLLP
jgi:Cd2+/Zn2+-exporting ATPase